MKDFIAGNYKKYRYSEKIEYDSFIPSFINRPFNLESSDISEIYPPLSKADRLVGELNSFSNLIPDIEIYIKMHIKNEAQKSSKIEGTQTELDEVILPEKAIKILSADSLKFCWIIFSLSLNTLWFISRSWILSSNFTNGIQIIKNTIINIQIIKPNLNLTGKLILFNFISNLPGGNNFWSKNHESKNEKLIAKIPNNDISCRDTNTLFSDISLVGFSLFCVLNKEYNQLTTFLIEWI